MTKYIAYYKDIILYNGIFYANKEEIKEVYCECNGDQLFKPLDMSLLIDLNKDIIEYDKGILYLHNLHSNIGHMLWDMMYPSWYGLYYYKENECDINFQWMVNNDIYNEWKDGWNLKLAENFSGNNITTPNILSNIYNKPVKIPFLIVGNYKISSVIDKTNYCLKMQLKSHLNDPVQTYVNRIYSKFNIKRNTFINNDNDKINIIYFLNMRQCYGIEELFEKLEKKYMNKCTFKIIDPYKYNFEEQLNIFNLTSIFITGVGTAISNIPLLPNGSITIQMNMHSLNNSNNIDFFHYYLSTYSKHIKVMNIEKYTEEEAKNKLISNELENYIDKAINDFPNKIFNVEENIPLYIKNLQINELNDHIKTTMPPRYMLE